MRGRDMLLWVLAAGLALGAVARAAPATPPPAEVSPAQQAFARGLLAALDDPDDEVAAKALLALASCLDCAPGVRERLQAFLQGPRATQALRAGAGPLWTYALITRGMLGEASPEVASRLVDLLMKEPADPLNSDEDIRLKEAAVLALGKMGEAARGQAPRLVGLLKQTAPDSKQLQTSGRALDALEKMGGAAREQIPQLVKLLEDPDPVLRMRAVRVLGEMGEAARAQAPRLVDVLLKDKDPNVRKTAANALGNLGEAASEQAPRLGRLLKDPNPAVRESAVVALGSMGQVAGEYVPRIGELLKDPDPGVRGHTAEALVSLGKAGQVDTTLAPRLAELLEDPNKDVRREAAFALGFMGEAAREYVPRLVGLLRDSESFGPAVALVRLREVARPQIPRLGELLEDPDPKVRRVAADVLGAMGEAAREQVPRLGELLKDEDAEVRRMAATSLGMLGGVAREQAPRLGELLKDREASVRVAAAQALGRMGAREQLPSLIRFLGEEATAPPVFLDEPVWEAIASMSPLELQHVAALVAVTGKDTSRRSRWMLRAHGAGGGDPSVERVLRWLGWRASMGLPQEKVLPIEEARATLHAFDELWPYTEQYPELRDDLAQQIPQVALLGRGQWRAADRALLERHEQHLSAFQPMLAENVRSVLDSISRGPSFLRTFGWAWAGHAGFWLLLIFFYPRSPNVQAFFFWNPWVRRILGFGYVGLLLTWVPPLRRRLLAPFHPLLLAEADLGRFSPEVYFSRSEVLVASLGQRVPLVEILPRLRGQVVLQGASGLGKSMFIRYLLCTSKDLAVFLPANRCEQGVLAAIQAKLEGHARDSAFLQSIIYSGALDIYIDGLNEVSADTRTRIAQFVEPKLHGSILLATQRMEWTPPATARVYELQPLTEEQVREFLLSREPLLDEHARLRGAAYREACEHFLEVALPPGQPEALRQAMLEVLSNPMDLTVVARMLAATLAPDLFHLREQQYEEMARDYREVNLTDFPLEAFSEEAYQMRLRDRGAIPEERFRKELLRMEAFKMVVRREWRSPDGQERCEWLFRHDKLQDFFIAQAFLGAGNARIVEHMKEPRFRGVYYLLAKLLPPEQAKALQERLVEYAAETHDHTVSDEFVTLLKARRRAEQVQSLLPGLAP